MIIYFLRSVGEACFTTESLQPRLINAWFDKIYIEWIAEKIIQHWIIHSFNDRYEFRLKLNDYTDRYEFRFWSGSGVRLGATDRPQAGWRSNPWGWKLHLNPNPLITTTFQILASAWKAWIRNVCLGPTVSVAELAKRAKTTQSQDTRGWG